MDKKEIVKGLGGVFAYLSSPKISFWEKFFITGFVLAYIISPIDLIPDIPVIGWLDDIGVGALFMAYCAHRVNVIEQREQKKDEKQIIDVTPTLTKNSVQENAPTVFQKNKIKSEDSIFTEKD